MHRYLLYCAEVSANITNNRNNHFRFMAASVFYNYLHLSYTKGTLTINETFNYNLEILLHCLLLKRMLQMHGILCRVTSDRLMLVLSGETRYEWRTVHLVIWTGKGRAQHWPNSTQQITRSRGQRSQTRHLFPLNILDVYWISSNIDFFV